MFSNEVALRIIGSLMKDHGITHKELHAVFPQRPATEEEFTAVAHWMSNLIQERRVGRVTPAPRGTEQTKSINPPRPSSPQAMSYDGIAPKPEPGKRAQAWHYALRTEAGEVKFYRVKAGRKEGFYFLDAQASDEYYPIKNRTHKAQILDAINADRHAALALYGQELGRCGRCGKVLTSEYRELGIGPVCINK